MSDIADVFQQMSDAAAMDARPAQTVEREALEKARAILAGPHFQGGAALVAIGQAYGILDDLLRAPAGDAQQRCGVTDGNARANWTPEQFWEYADGLLGTHVRDQMRDMMAGQGLAVAPAGSGAQIGDDDLVQRCRELLEWSSTGLLAGGKGGAVRALADRLKEKVGDHYALNVAESQTRDDAMRAVVATALSPETAKGREPGCGHHGCHDPNCTYGQGQNIDPISSVVPSANRGSE